MVMIFSNEKVREYLLENGLVYTYRKNHRKTPDGIRPQIGRDWATDKRGGKKIADIYITPIEPVDCKTMKNVLRKYARDSGFYIGSDFHHESVSRWVRAINSLNPFAPRDGWIYQVEVRRTDS